MSHLRLPGLAFRMYPNEALGGSLEELQAESLNAFASFHPCVFVECLSRTGHWMKTHLLAHWGLAI